MKKTVILLLLLCLPACALASDLTDMSTDELVRLRRSVDLEIASRIGTDAEQVVMVNDIAFRLLSYESGYGNDEKPGIIITFLVNNMGEESMTPLYDLDISALQGGVPLSYSWIKSEHYGSGAVSTSHSTVIAPGAENVQISLGFLFSGDSDRLELILAKRHRHIGEDPYCGTFVIDLSTLD